MGEVHISDDLKQLIDRQIAAGRATSEAEFLAQAVQRYAEALEADIDETVAAADEGIADIEAGRFELLTSAEDIQRLRSDLAAALDPQAARRRSTDP